jgi:hypothetical protein
VVKNKDGTRARGSKRATVRPLLDSAGLLTQVALAAIHVHDMALCRPVLGLCSSQSGACSVGRRSRT